MKALHYFTVDVFTTTQFGGNPLAVFPDGRGLSTELMQKIAKELNLSETTFMLPPENPGSDCRVRIFTPAAELPMAGHPTIGTAFVLLTNKLLQPRNKTQLVFDLGVGPVKVTFSQNAEDDFFITMEQPLPLFGEVYENISEIAEILSLPPDAIRPDLPVQSVSCGTPVVVIPVVSLEAIQKARVKTDLLEKYLMDFESRLLYLFTMETLNGESTTHSRLFAPLHGIPEDPATGGASGPLGAYLVKYNLHSGTSIRNEQGFEMGRPSLIHIDIESEKKEIRKVKVSGNCVATGTGTYNINEL